ncbi:hypothetical protein OSB04_017259 [Centaurea solstitialis]|uniref:CCHC-type domain-containing protein n=1 Tax=Centaurea solstitialis TaxID=347529 RepID=A0AA38T2K6_9ASTR|nr:hypothetical protein OSB04_017259 [Centaurea solstitialis]
MAGRNLRSRVIPEPEVPPPPTRTTAVRGRVGSRGRGRGRGRVGRAATEVSARVQPRARGGRQAHSERPPVIPEPSQQESSASHPAPFVTKEDFQTEMGKLQATLQNLLEQQGRSRSEGEKDDSDVNSPPATVVGGHSRSTPSEVVVPPRPVHGCNYKAFSACKPPIYKGERDPVLAMRWVKEMEMVFETCRCAEEDKTGGRATEAVRSLTWEEFVKKFKLQFCPMTTTKKMEEEFLQLEQGNSSVQEYTTRFIEKARFAGVYVPTEGRKVERFIWGLRGNLREFVLSKEPDTFQAAINAADTIEHEKNRQVTERMGEKRKWDGPATDPRKGRFPRTDSIGGPNPNVRPCGRCQKVHQGDCRFGPPTCFRCGQPGHLSQDCTTRKSCYKCGSPNHFRTECPQLKKGGGPVPRERVVAPRDDRKAAPALVRGRAFRMTADEAEEAPDVVTGTFLVNSLRAKIIYATPELLKLSCVKLEPLDRPYEADTANRPVWVRDISKGCTIEIDGCLVPAALSPIPMEGLDVILGMDWLIRNKAKIDCEQKMVCVQLPDGRSTVIYGVKRDRSSRLISVIKANRCIWKGCIWFLAYVINSGKEKLEVKDVEVVLPPEREIEFRIDLVPGATPIAKAL